MKKLVLMLVLPCLVTMPLAAESHEEMDYNAPKYVIVHTDVVDPADAPAYEDNARAWVEAFREAEMGEEWTWWASTGPAFHYNIVFPVMSMAELDNDEARQKAMAEAVGEEKLAELGKGAELIRSHSSILVKSRRDLSYDPGMEGPPGYMEIGTHHVKPSMGKAFEEVAKKVMAAAAKAEYPVAMDAYEVEFGEGAYIYVGIAASEEAYSAAPSIPEMVIGALGEEEGNALMAEWRDCITGYESHDGIPRMDLSYMPAMAAAMEAGEAAESSR